MQAPAVNSWHPEALTSINAAGRLAGHVAGTSAANAGAFDENAMATRTLPSPSPSVAVSEKLSRSPAHVPAAIAPSSVPHRGCSRGIASEAWPDWQASFDRAPQAVPRPQAGQRLFRPGATARYSF